MSMQHIVIYLVFIVYRQLIQKYCTALHEQHQVMQAGNKLHTVRFTNCAILPVYHVNSATDQFNDIFI